MGLNALIVTTKSLGADIHPIIYFNGLESLCLS